MQQPRRRITVPISGPSCQHVHSRSVWDVISPRKGFVLGRGRYAGGPTFHRRNCHRATDDKDIRPSRDSENPEGPKVELDQRVSDCAPDHVAFAGRRLVVKTIIWAAGVRA